MGLYGLNIYLSCCYTVFYVIKIEAVFRRKFAWLIIAKK